MLEERMQSNLQIRHLNVLRNFFMMKNTFSCRILTGEVYFHRWHLTFNSLITLLDHTTAEVGEIERQQHRAVFRLY